VGVVCNGFDFRQQVWGEGLVEEGHERGRGMKQRTQKVCRGKPKWVRGLRGE